jgi:transposase-like protein
MIIMCKDTTKTYTIKQFQQEYATEEICLDKIFKLTHLSSICPKCKIVADYKRIPTRRCYQCPKCCNQIYPTAGTPFEKTTTPLMYWFYAMYLFTVSKNGLSATELQRHIGVTYKTAWRMLRQIRLLIKVDTCMFAGVTEVDETFVGGKNKNRHADKKFKYSQGRSFQDKTPVVGLLNRDLKEVRCIVTADTSTSSLHPIITHNIGKDSILMTDEWRGYNGLSADYDHQRVDHGRKQYVNDCGATTNAIENFWSILKRTVNGSYIHVSRKYLQLYANECAFRFNNRDNKQIFNSLICCLSS